MSPHDHRAADHVKPDVGVLHLDQREDHSRGTLAQLLGHPTDGPPTDAHLVRPDDDTGFLARDHAETQGHRIGAARGVRLGHHGDGRAPTETAQFCFEETLHSRLDHEHQSVHRGSDGVEDPTQETSPGHLHQSLGLDSSQASALTRRGHDRRRQAATTTPVNRTNASMLATHPSVATWCPSQDAPAALKWTARAPAAAALARP